ncbi:MAG: hypothetical protein AAGK74_17000 [Chloroflexota bacterium]
MSPDEVSHPDCHAARTPQGYIHFQFLKISDETLNAWRVLHHNMYTHPEQYRMVCMLIDLPKENLMPFAHITSYAKAYISGGEPFLPTRHAFVTDAALPIELIQGMVKTLPAIDLQAMFYKTAERDDAVAWLLSEIDEINSSAAGTTPPGC